jgi:hypothetical protein
LVHNLIITHSLFLEYGHADVNITKVNSNVDRLFAGLGDEIPVFMSHYDKLISLPEVSGMSSYFRSTMIDSDRVLWSLVPPRTLSTLASPMRRSPSLVCLPPECLYGPVKEDANAMLNRCPIPPRARTRSLSPDALY